MSQQPSPTLTSEQLGAADELETTIMVSLVRRPGVAFPPHLLSTTNGAVPGEQARASLRDVLVELAARHAIVATNTDQGPRFTVPATAHPDWHPSSKVIAEALNLLDDGNPSAPAPTVCATWNITLEEYKSAREEMGAERRENARLAAEQRMNEPAPVRVHRPANSDFDPYDVIPEARFGSSPASDGPGAAAGPLAL